MDKEISIFRQQIIEMTRNPMMSEFTGERIVERLTEKDLVKIEKIMKKHTTLTITTFLRIFRNVLHPTHEEDFYLSYGLFRLFQEVCLSSRKNEVSFADISTIITEKMPSSNQEALLSQKMYPLQLEIPDNIKKKIFAPLIIGKVLEQRERLEQQPYLSDKFIHLNRRVGQSYYSQTNNYFLTVDYPSADIKIMSSEFQIIKTVHTQLQISKRDAIVTWIAWSEEQQRVAALLGNNSISLWAKQDNFRYEVNVPLPMNLLLTPYTMIGYLESSKKWYALDNRPSVYILSHYNYEPQYTFTHFKMIKEKDSERIFTTELKYRKLLCLAFEKNVFLISLEKKELITQLRNFRTAITSIAFSETYQALFVSNFENYFTSYQLSQHQDLTEKGKFEGHKNLISLIGVLEHRPVVYSIDQKSIIKLWDVRDFTCYQTFSVLKNITFRQVLALPESICLVGSKHYCYRWQRYSNFREKQIVVLVCQLEKNILVVTSKQVRLFNHSNGVLIKVVKGIFSASFIAKAYLVELRKLLLLVNEEGETVVYSTKDFTVLGKYNLLPKPHYFFYEKETELLTICCMGEIRICEYKQITDLPLKRRIHNRKEIISFCRVSPAHDIIAVQFEDNPYLFFYSYERAKPLGFLLVEDLVSMEFLPQKNAIFLLCKDKILIMSFKKYVNSISFFLKRMIDLWEKQEIENSGIILALKSYDAIVSTDFLIFDDIIIVSSNDAFYQCRIKIKTTLINAEKIKISRDNYNPYRIASEDHLQAFQMNKPSLIIDDTNLAILQDKIYVKNQGNQDFQRLSQISLFYCITDEHHINFYNLDTHNKGTLNVKETLPLNWNLHNYSQEEFNELQFVYEFIEQEKPTQIKLLESTFNLTNPNMKSEEMITLSMLSSSKSKIDTSRSTSLREKKMVLEKERDQKQKYENFMEIRRGEELVKLKQINKSTNQKYVGQSIAFLNVNRNKLLLSKGPNETQLPQIRALEIKLNAAINRDEKKSMVSKYSGGLQYSSPVRKVVHAQQQIAKSAIKTTNEIKLFHEQSDKQTYKDRLKRLDLSLRQSKFNHKQRSGSLPLLKMA